MLGAEGDVNAQISTTNLILSLTVTQGTFMTTVIAVEQKMLSQADTALEVIDRAQALLSQDDAIGALAALDLGLSARPTHQGLVQKKLEVLRHMKRYAEAWSFCRSLPTAAKNAPILVSMINIALANKEVDAARSLLLEAEASNMDRRGYLLLAVKVTEHSEGAGAAILLLENQGSDIINRPKLMREYARLLVDVGRANEALLKLDKAVSRTPVPLLVIFLIKLEFANGRYDRVSMLVGKHSDLAEAHPDLYLLAVRAADLQGELHLALSQVEAAVQRFPCHRELNKTLWQLLSRTGQMSKAVEASLAFADSNPSHLLSQLSVARFFLAVKDEESCDQLIERARQLAPDSEDVLLLHAQALLARDDAMGALNLFSNVEDSTNKSPSVQILLAKIEKALGKYSEAISRLESVVVNLPSHQYAKLVLARLYVFLGLGDQSEILLESIPEKNTKFVWSRWELRSDIALIQGQLCEALNAIDEAVLHNSTYAGIWRKRSQIQLLLGKTEDAWHSHLQALKYRSLNNVSGRSTNKARRSIHGQILNEYRLSEPSEIQRYCAANANQKSAMRYFRTCVVENPQSTASALCLLGAIHRSGLIVDMPMKEQIKVNSPNQIPKQIFQYWDTEELPDQVAAIMKRNCILNPDFKHRRFNEKEARSYLFEKGESKALRALRLAPHSAAKADIFRLAVLWHEGGVYIDVDDRCLSPLATFVDLRCRFIGYQERMMSIGNNFLAARPKDPIIRAALESASVAFSATQGESIWLSTGPGAITRAVALHGTRDDGSFSEGVWIMSMSRLQREIALHTRLSYKSTDRNWLNASKMA